MNFDAAKDDMTTAIISTISVVFLINLLKYSISDVPLIKKKIKKKGKKERKETDNYIHDIQRLGATCEWCPEPTSLEMSPNLV